MSQAELARQTGRSAGTVAYYLAHAGPGVVTRRRDGVLVDLDRLRSARARLARRRRRCDDVADVLMATWGRPCSGGGFELLVASGNRAPTLADIAAHLGVARSTAQRHLSDLNAQGRLRRCGSRVFLDGPSDAHRPPDGEHLQAAVPEGQQQRAHRAAGRGHGQQPSSEGLSEPLLAEVAQALLETCERLARLVDHLMNGADPRALSRNPRGSIAHIAEARESTESLPEEGFSTSTETVRKLAYSAAKQEALRAGPRGPANEDDPEPAGATSPLTDAELDRALASLMAACRDHGLPDVLDRRGRSELRGLHPDGLTRAAQSIERQVRSGYRMSNPLGILVKAAMEGDDGLFAVPGPASQPADPQQRSRLLLGAATLGRSWAAGGADPHEVRQWAQSAFPQDAEAAAEALDAYVIATTDTPFAADQRPGKCREASSNDTSSQTTPSPIARAI
jgi:hypothetical protein